MLTELRALSKRSFLLALASTLSACAVGKVVNEVDGHNRRVQIQDRLMWMHIDADEDALKKCATENASHQYQTNKTPAEISKASLTDCDVKQYLSDYVYYLRRHAKLNRQPEPLDADEQAMLASQQMIARTESAVTRAVEQYRAAAAQRIANLRASHDPWDKYLLFSELSAGTIEPLDPEEVSRAARDAFIGFGLCAKETEPSCMDMYGELILRGADSLDPRGKADAHKKAVYWLSLAARYGYERARKVLVSEGEDIPSPDLAMEKLQKEANDIAVNSQTNAERIAREKAARDYELIRESRRQTEQMIWANLFPKMVNCTSNKVGSYTYTNCW